MITLICILVILSIFAYFLSQFRMSHIQYAFKYVGICVLFSTLPTLVDIVLYLMHVRPDLKPSTNLTTLLLYTSSFLSPIMFRVFEKFDEDGEFKLNRKENKQRSGIQNFSFAIIGAFLVLLFSIILYLVPSDSIPVKDAIFWSFILYSIGMWLIISAESDRIKRPLQYGEEERGAENEFSNTTEDLK